MKKNVLLVIALMTLGYKVSMAQTSCAQTLRLAQSIYEQGRLHELENTLAECLKGNNFNNQEKVAAYKLLALTYIYLEEPEKADNAMLTILRTENEYQVNESADPAEFVALYKTFRTDPIYRIGGRALATFTQPNVISSDEVNDGTSEYAYKLGYAAHVAAEIPLNGRFKKFLINPELGFQNRTFSNTNTQDDFVAEGIESQNWISLPVSIQYKLGKIKEIEFYLSTGIAVDYLLSSELTATKVRGQNASSLPEKNIDVREDRNSINSGLLFSAGGKKKLGNGYLIGEIRFQYGLTAVSNTEGTFSNPTLTFDYSLVDSIYKLNTLTVSVGYLVNVYNPKKLTR